MVIGAVFALLPMIGAAFAIAKIVAAYVDGMTRNPEGDKSGSRRTITLIGIAAVELVVLFAFAIAFLALGIK